VIGDQPQLANSNSGLHGRKPGRATLEDPQTSAPRLSAASSAQHGTNSTRPVQRRITEHAVPNGGDDERLFRATLGNDHRPVVSAVAARISAALTKPGDPNHRFEPGQQPGSRRPLGTTGSEDGKTSGLFLDELISARNGVA
jgi:hypothetical protein